MHGRHTCQGASGGSLGEKKTFDDIKLQRLLIHGYSKLLGILTRPARMPDDIAACSSENDTVRNHHLTFLFFLGQSARFKAGT